MIGKMRGMTSRRSCRQTQRRNEGSGLFARLLAVGTEQGAAAGDLSQSYRNVDLVQMSSRALYVDYTHVGRRRSGIERITQELFNETRFPDIHIRKVSCPPWKAMVLIAQMIGLPLYAMLRRGDVFLFPGFPPSPFTAFARERCIMYVHDLFLITRRRDLNFAAKWYMAPLFSFAVRRLKYFFANSETTAYGLRALVTRESQVLIYRPEIRNVFDLAIGDRIQRADTPDVMRVVAIGTVEPRKNYIAAADICASLAHQRQSPVELHIIGRAGWGDDWSRLAQRSGVVLHGALSDKQAGKVIAEADILICSSHDEGLGLPLLEVQHGGLPVIAPDKPVFREVLGTSGLYVDPDDTDQAARIIIESCAAVGWRRRSVAAAISNLQRWNRLANSDRHNVELFLKQMLTE